MTFSTKCITATLLLFKFALSSFSFSFLTHSLGLILKFFTAFWFIFLGVSICCWKASEFINWSQSIFTEIFIKVSPKKKVANCRWFVIQAKEGHPDVKRDTKKNSSPKEKLRDLPLTNLQSMAWSTNFRLQMFLFWTIKVKIFECRQTSHDEFYPAKY